MASEIKNLLYVEDEPDIRELCVMALEMFGGYRVFACGTGLEALEQYQHQTIDLVLLDRILPDMDGLALLEKIQTLPGRGPVPVIVMSALATGVGHDGSESWVIGCIPKPFDPETLHLEVGKLWHDWLARQAPAS